MTIDYPWYAVMLCILCGALYAAVMYAAGGRNYPRGVRWLLAALRFLAVGGLSLLLLAPVRRQQVNERQLPTVVLARDVSGSVASGADSAFRMEELAKAIEGRCRVVSDTFGTASATDLGEMLVRHRAEGVAAVVVASDGIHNRGANPATVAEGLPFPVYTVALGDTTARRDAALSSLQAGRIASLGGTIPVEVAVKATLLGGHGAMMTIADAEGRVLFRQRVEYDGEDFAATIAASLPASEAGLQRFTVRIGDAGGEATLANNSLSFYVDVIDSRRRVAIIGNAAHPDLGALKRAIESNANYEAVVVDAADAERGKWKATDGEWSMAVLHNLPSRRHPRIDYATDLPKLFVVGLQTDLARFNALRTGLEITSKSTGSSEVTALRREAFGLFNLDAADAAAVEAMPPLVAPFGEARLATGVQTLFGARIATIDTRQPLVAATVHGGDGLRTAFVWGEGLWRWRLADWQNSESFSHFDRIVSQIVGFTAMQQQRERLQVDAERSYAGGETVVLRAQLYNESYELYNRPEVRLHLEGDSATADYTFGREGNGYRLTLPGLKAGLYRYTATTGDGQECHGSFAVEDINVEQRRLTADHGLLRTVSAVSGGRMYMRDSLDALAEDLAAFKPVIHTHTRYAEMLRLPAVLVLIMLLLAAEWVLRKYNGEI